MHDKSVNTGTQLTLVVKSYEIVEFDEFNYNARHKIDRYTNLFTSFIKFVAPFKLIFRFLWIAATNSGIWWLRQPLSTKSSYQIVNLRGKPIDYI